MLIKIILALAIACMFMGGIGAAGGITGLKTAIADKQTVSNSAMLDKAIINWYTAHDYELPESLSKEMLAIMGLRDIDLSKFTYTKLSDNKFRLVANLSGKKTETSVNSNRDLPLKPSEDAPSNIGGVNSGSTTSPGTESKPDGSTGSTTTPDTGESGGSSGGSGTTVGGGSGSTTTPDSSESGSSGGSNIKGESPAKVGDSISVDYNDRTITIPSNVIEISVSAFAGCHHRNNLNGGCNLYVVVNGKTYSMNRTDIVYIPVSAGKLSFDYYVGHYSGTFATSTGEPDIDFYGICVTKVS